MRICVLLAKLCCEHAFSRAPREEVLNRLARGKPVGKVDGSCVRQTAATSTGSDRGAASDAPAWIEVYSHREARWLPADPVHAIADDALSILGHWNRDLVT
eukprot:SAG31_NODE_600_length_13647_cov_3.894376_16_plen_101_part_00